MKLSPRYMGTGIREAARELFSSPVFLTSVCLSVVLYFAAWLNPEPFFSKAFAVTLTAALALTVGMLEVANLARAFLRLYRESEAARTEKELELAARESAGHSQLRRLPTLPLSARSALCTVARRLIAATFPNASISAAVVLEAVGRAEDAAFLEAHSPEYPTLAKVFYDAAKTLRNLH